ncbi:unnamed protein product [Zymoseptoria tritici ST99CH_3D7]|uniref:Uncharacterized protein n=4 Tax=Zymoseptoria tritici TaxID=1047171 RepID=A0A1X7S139_ZYMT9|nr:unnamed protein product [Zymoseptoria tritici ST99CH_3D7]
MLINHISKPSIKLVSFSVQLHLNYQETFETIYTFDLELHNPSELNLDIAMNTVRSVGYGWGVLIVAGGGSYYFAKRSINSDREERARAEEERRQNAERLRVQEAMTRNRAMGDKAAAKRAATGDHPSPSREAAGDPAPVDHVEEPVRGKYEAAVPFRSKKGDRFS